MKCLVTGATGFIGSWVVRKLVERGECARILARRTSVLDRLAGLDIQITYGDLRDGSSLLEAVKGCDVLYHIAAVHDSWIPDPRNFYEVNVQGTHNILEAAFKQGVQKVVYTSTNNTIGLPQVGDTATEKTKFNWWNSADHYTRSKVLGERKALEMWEKGLPVIIVNPGAPLGPGDAGPTPLGRLIVNFLKKKIPGYIDGTLNVIDVEDVALGHIQAAEKGRVGERYILGNQNLTFKEFFELLQKNSGIKARSIRIPPTVALGLAYAFEFVISPLTHRPPVISLTTAKRAQKRVLLDSTKAVRELGLRQTSVNQSLKRGIDWFIEFGYT
jgi:dihydroflavonol-4-reductase